MTDCCPLQRELCHASIGSKCICLFSIASVCLPAVCVCMLCAKITFASQMPCSAFKISRNIFGFKSRRNQLKSARHAFVVTCFLRRDVYPSLPGSPHIQTAYLSDLCTSATDLHLSLWLHFVQIVTKSFCSQGIKWRNPAIISQLKSAAEAAKVGQPAWPAFQSAVCRFSCICVLLHPSQQCCRACTLCFALAVSTLLFVKAAAIATLLCHLPIISLEA